MDPPPRPPTAQPTGPPSEPAAATPAASGQPPAMPSATPPTTPSPSVSGTAPALSSPPTDREKVKVSDTILNSSFDSNSGYLTSNSDTCGNSLFNYSKYGTRSKVGEGETYIETEKPQLSSTYYQCKAARAACMSYQTVNVSLGPEAGSVDSVKHASIGSLDSLGDTEILRTFRGSRITAGGITVNQNISATFDPANLKCVICENPHYILSKGVDDSPPILIFSDQKFVPTLSGGKKLHRNC
jgi:hypothetical protein